MIEFEALRAEVYRRGEEKKIKIKKTRRRVIALCVPLVLCVTAAGLLPQTAKNGGKADNMLSAPEFFRADDVQMEAVMDTETAMTTPATQTASSDSLVSSQVAVEVTSAEGWVWYSKDTQKILEISEALYAITGVQEDAYTTVEDTKATSADLAPGSFLITFADREGGRIVYLLTEDRLEVTADRLEFSVTPEQYARLQSLLAP